jgi:hypothetical protein
VPNIIAMIKHNAKDQQCDLSLFVSN